MKLKPSQPPVVIPVYCGELCNSNLCNSSMINLLNRDIEDIVANITVGFGNFIHNPENLPPRILDLLQIAAYVYCADRLVNRGERSSVNNSAWARSFEFHIPVFDIDFWSNDKVSMKMGEALKFMTGDRRYQFSFEAAMVSPIEDKVVQLSLFSNEYATIDEAEKTDVMLFSGGLDSLAGAIQRLNDYPERKLCLVSHKSSNTTTHTQNIIVKYLQDSYGNRVTQYGFECHNKKNAPSRDETQRTRMFLFSSIAFAICNCYNKKEFFVYENGITSINLPKQGDVINARASRTTHPKTVGLLRDFFMLFNKNFDIKMPYYNQTKADIFKVFRTYHEENIITSSVSCSSTRKPQTTSTHCGCCSQCIERVFAAYASSLVEYDVVYAYDFIKLIPDQETKQRLYNTLRLASAEIAVGKNEFFKKYPDEIMDVINYWPEDNPDDSLEEIYQLFCSWGDSILRATKAMQLKFDDLSIAFDNNSFLEMIAQRQYLISPVQIRVNEIDTLLRKAIPKTFQREKPKSENDFNDKVQGILCNHGSFSREYPVLHFGETVYKPDHAEDGLVIESKYLRTNTTPSIASEGIAADIVKIPSTVAGILFVVYDPERKIVDDDVFITSFNDKRDSCYVKIYR